MRRLCGLIISWLFGFAVHAQTGTDDSASRAAFDGVVSEVEAHYAGYFDKVTPSTRATYVAMWRNYVRGCPHGMRTLPSANTLAGSRTCTYMLALEEKDSSPSRESL